MKIGIIYRDRCREVIVKTVSRFFEVVTFKIPEDLPDVLEERFDFPDELFDTDLIISYAFHTNVNEDLIRRADLENVNTILITGKFRFLKSLAKRVRVVVDDICCSTVVKDLDYSKRFGIPEFRLEIQDGKIVKAEVLRSAPCGVTYTVAKSLVGLDVDSAIQNVGLIVQHHCLANRDGLHKSAKIHTLAVKRAVKRSL